MNAPMISTVSEISRCSFYCYGPTTVTLLYVDSNNKGPKTRVCNCKRISRTVSSCNFSTYPGVGLITAETCSSWWILINKSCVLHHHHHHYVPEGLSVFPVPWSSRWGWSLHLLLGRPMFLRLFGLYCSACFGSLFVSILCTCCSHFFWYCFISCTVFCAPVFCLMHWFFSLCG